MCQTTQYPLPLACSTWTRGIYSVSSVARFPTQIYYNNEGNYILPFSNYIVSFILPLKFQNPLNFPVDYYFSISLVQLYNFSYYICQN